MAPALSSVGIILISAAFSFLNAWGFFHASEQAPFDIAGLSPVPFLLIIGVVLVQAFFRSTRRRMDDGKPVLFSLDVLRSSRERVDRRLHGADALHRYGDELPAAALHAGRAGPQRVPDLAVDRAVHACRSSWPTPRCHASTTGSAPPTSPGSPSSSCSSRSPSWRSRSATTGARCRSWSDWSRSGSRRGASSHSCSTSS